MLDKAADQKEEFMPYRGPTSPYALNEIFIQDAFANDDERLWMQMTPYSQPGLLGASF